MEVSILSPQGQTTVPSAVRQILQIKAGMQLRWQVVDDVQGVKQVVVRVPSSQAVSSLKGIAKNLYSKYGGGKKYLELERKSWDRK